MIYLYCKGVSRGQPGRGGWGVHAVDEHGATLTRLNGHLPSATPNEAEIESVIAGVGFALQQRERTVRVYTNNAFVTRLITGHSMPRQPNLLKCYARLAAVANALSEIEIKLVSTDDNETAIGLARQAREGVTVLRTVRERAIG